MMRVSRLTDYGILLLGYLAAGTPYKLSNARDLAQQAGLPLGTVGKILKVLARQGLLISHRGAHGGYTLARSPREITVGQVYFAMEGPILVTQGGVPKALRCSIGGNWSKLNEAVALAFAGISLWDMTSVLGPRWDDEREM